MYQVLFLKIVLSPFYAIFVVCWLQSLQIRNEWSKIFYGRDDILKEIETYVKKPNNQSPYALFGESGCGKTALVAKCAKLAAQWVTTGTPAIIVRFLGKHIGCTKLDVNTLQEYIEIKKIKLLLLITQLCCNGIIIKLI